MNDITMKQLHTLLGSRIQTHDILIEGNGDHFIAWTKYGERIKPIDGHEMLSAILKEARYMDSMFEDANPQEETIEELPF